MAELLTLCGVKHIELEPHLQKWKGRIVYRGDYVTDASHNIVLFDDIATSPIALPSLNLKFWFGCRKGSTLTFSDAIQAFLQAKLEEDTWVVLPYELWTSDMRAKFDSNAKIAVKLLRSLYGHPLAGNFWQEHLAQKLRSLGGEEVPGHPSNWLFWFKRELLVLNIYVDDLSLAGKVELHQEFWELLRKHIKIEPETKIEDGARILGRNHTIHRSPSETTVTLDMRAYAEQVVELYLELSGLERKKLRKVPMPCLLEASIADDDLAEEGELGSVAARILMKMLWLARLSRPDLYFITGRLATKVTRWTRWEDLFRAIGYLNGTVDLCLTASVSHDEEPSFHVYTDAGFGSCPFTSKSTSGILTCVETGSSRFPVFWSSRKQSSISSALNA